MGSTDNSAIMTIDLKWNRFRIHKSTLNKMGNPQYVQFLVNPEEMFIAVLGSDRPLTGGTRTAEPGHRFKKCIRNTWDIPSYIIR